MTDISTEAARARLPVQGEPHWHQIGAVGEYLGCRRGLKGDSWIARRRPPGGRKTHWSLGPVESMTYTDAVRAALAEFEKLAGPKPGEMTIARAVLDYLDHLHDEKAETTYKVSKGRADRYILPPLGGLRLSTLTGETVNDWLRQTKFAGATKRSRQVNANKIWAILRAAIRRAPAKQRPSPAEMAEVRSFKASTPPRDIFLSEAQAQRWVNCAEGELRPVLKFLLLTGCRPGEARLATVGDLDLGEALWVVRSSKTQHARDRRGLPPAVCVLDGGTVALLRPLVAGKPPGAHVFLRDDGSPWIRTALSKAVRRATLKAGLDPKTVAYTARHSFISWRLKAGVPMLALAQNLRTSVRELEASYGKFSLTDRRALLERGAVEFEGEESNVVSI